LIYLSPNESKDLSSLYLSDDLDWPRKVLGRIIGQPKEISAVLDIQWLPNTIEKLGLKEEITAFGPSSVRIF